MCQINYDDLLITQIRFCFQIIAMHYIFVTYLESGGQTATTFSQVPRVEDE